MGLKRNNSSIDFLHSQQKCHSQHVYIALKFQLHPFTGGMFERKKSQIALEMQCEELRGEAQGTLGVFLDPTYLHE